MRAPFAILILTLILPTLTPLRALAQDPPPPEDAVPDDEIPPEDAEPPAEAAPPSQPAPSQPAPAQPADPNAPKPPAQPAPPAPPVEDEVRAEEEVPAEDEMSAEDAELLKEVEGGGEDPSRPPAKGKGAIWGVIGDSVEKEPLPEASVTVVGTQFKTMADIDGRYRLELPPGKYTLRFFYELHRPALIKDVVVVAGRVERLDAEVIPDEAAVETFEVETQADTTSVEGQVLARQRATAVGDGVGRSEISKTPASNAAQAAQRVVGATIVGNRFVYVRGLGERYTNALLNDAPLPSPEPDRAAIPLDIFPALILDNLTIVKTFTPDVPADFAGGSVRIQTRELPSKPLFQASLGLGFDDQTTFQKRLAQRGSSTDYLGFDSGARAIPPLLDHASITDLSEQGQLRASRDLNAYMSAIRRTSPPNYSLSAVAGNGWALSGEQRFGALATINYGRSYTLRDDIVQRTFRAGTPAPDGSATPAESSNDYRSEFGNDRVSWGALGSVSYWPAQHHRLSLLGLHTQLADASAQIWQGINQGRSAEIAATRLRYVSRALDFGQLRGEHDFSALSNARLEWNAALSHAARDEPDTRDTVFQKSTGSDEFTSINTADNGAHFFSRQGESTVGGGLDWSQPLTRATDATKLKLGGLLSLKSRDFRAKRFHLSEVSPIFSCGPEFFLACADRLYIGRNIDDGVLTLNEDTRPEDAYKAELDVYSAYAMADLALGSDVRVVGGARIEVTRQELNPYSPFVGAVPPESTSIDSTDVLPALSVVYSATKRTKLRASYSRTLARPQLRELSPFVFADFFGGRAFGGNPELKLTYVNNGDLRLEYFPTQREVMAFSFFAKDFENPIENVILDSGSDGTVQPQNAKGGTLLGLELEARKSLEDLSHALRFFSLIANFTLATSRIEIDESDMLVSVTNPSRAMVNQAPWVVNLALDYSNEDSGTSVRLLYNVAGRRIIEVGTKDLDDTYEQPKHLVDLTLSQNAGKHVQLKLTGANLLAAKHVTTVGRENRDDQVQQSFTESRVFSLSATYTY